MKQLFLLCLLFLFATSPTFSQRYLLEFDDEKSAELLDKAEQAYVDKNYERSAKLYGKLLQKEGETPEILFNQLTALVHLTDTAMIAKTFDKLNNTDWIDCNFLSKTQDFTEIKYKQIFKIWQKAVRTCGQNNKIFNEKIKNPELRLQLLWLQMEDITADMRLIQKFKYNAEKDISLDELKLERKKTYVKNFFTLLNIIEDNGWLGIQEVGKDGAKAAWLIAQHGNHMVSQQVEILEMMEQAMLENNFEKQYYAHLYDRVQANQRKPQRYGTLRYRDDETGEWKLYAVEDESKLNTFREEVGLPPLKK